MASSKEILETINARYPLREVGRDSGALVIWRQERLLGLVENMSGFECRHCGQREEIFGSGGARRYGMANNISFLGEVPLATDIRTTSDEGHPIVESMPNSPSARAFFRLAENLAAQISTLNMGGASTDRPEIAEITRPSQNEVRIRWKDGHEGVYSGYALCVACSCALCVDETSGKKRLRDESIRKDVYPLSTVEDRTHHA